MELVSCLIQYIPTEMRPPFFYERFHYLEIMNINSRESSGGKFVEKTATGAGEEA
jgi:hypothetical protein